MHSLKRVRIHTYKTSAYILIYAHIMHLFVHKLKVKAKMCTSHLLHIRIRTYVLMSTYIYTHTFCLEEVGLKSLWGLIVAKTKAQAYNNDSNDKLQRCKQQQQNNHERPPEAPQPPNTATLNEYSLLKKLLNAQMRIHTHVCIVRHSVCGNVVCNITYAPKLSAPQCIATRTRSTRRAYEYLHLLGRAKRAQWRWLGKRSARSITRRICKNSSIINVMTQRPEEEEEA